MLTEGTGVHPQISRKSHQELDMMHTCNQKAKAGGSLSVPGQPALPTKASLHYTARP